MKKKFLSLLSLTLALLMLLSACAGKTETPADSSSEESAADSTPSGFVDDVEGKLSIFFNGERRISAIVYPEKGMGAEAEGADLIFRRFNTFFQTSGKVPMKDDFLLPGETRDPNAVEILVGLTNYQESKDVLATLDYGDYAVRVVGNKIVCIGMTSEGTTKACELLSKYVLNNVSYNSETKQRSLLIDRTYNNTGTILAAANDIPKMDGLTNISICDSGDDCICLTAKDADLATFNAYGALLLSQGYTLYDSHDILVETNKYAQYVNDAYSATVIFSTATKKMQILFEPLAQTALIAKQAESYVTFDGYVPKMWQVGVTDPVGSGDDTYNGQCYIYQLADGSYVVYDGGMDEVMYNSKYNRQNGRRIYEIMKANAPDPNNIKVAAWVVTHAHTDHIGALMAFESLGYDDIVSLEAVICNIPGESQYATESNDAEMDGKIEGYRDVLDRMTKNNGTKIYKAHPGQNFYLRNAVIEILYTHDFRATEPMNAFNNTSIVSRITLYQADGTKANSVMMTGDTYGDSTNIMVAMYGTALKTDFLQLSHHGHSNGVSGTWFGLVNPSYALWPISASKDETDQKGYNQVVNNGKNEWIWNNIPDQIYFAFWTTTEFILPFDGTANTYTVTPNITYTA